MRVINQLTFFLFITFFSAFQSYSQIYKIIQSETEYVIIDFNFNSTYFVKDTLVEGRTFQKIYGPDLTYRNPGEPWLPEYSVLAGIPFGSKPTIKVLEQKQQIKKNQFILPYPETDPGLTTTEFNNLDQEVYSKNQLFPLSAASLGESYVVRFANIIPITISPFQFNPVTRELIYNYSVRVRIDFNTVENSDYIHLNDAMTENFLETSVVNPVIAKSFIGKSNVKDASLVQDLSWYNPNKNYFKIYVKNKNLYRLTYEELVAAGAQLGSNTLVSKLELFNDGLPVPIEVFDNNSDGFFNSGDYFQFAGFPATPTPYCTLNIYNLSNVYWFSYQSDSTGLNYVKMSGLTDFYNRTYFRSLTTLHYEKDSLYERLAYAPANQERDYWFWDKTTSLDSSIDYAFNQYFDGFPLWYSDSTQVRLRVALQGMTNSSYCQNDHKAYIYINEVLIGDIIWDGQQNVIFDKVFTAGPNGVPIYAGNYLKVAVTGDLCGYVDDNIRINWFEFDYWRANSIYTNYFNFINYDTNGINRYGIFDWYGSDMRIYIPGKNKLIHQTSTGTYTEFMDTSSSRTEYFLAASNYFAVVDSIIADNSSDLRNAFNGADYIIITHHKFSSIAEQLAAFRQNNFPDTSISNPRIMVVDVQDIYDEFSYGLLNPFAIKDFVKYAFDNWQLPPPSYIVLLGDMSYDYRGLLASSRPNFIPAIPYFSNGYGQAASDNLFVAVSGNDVAPDLAIGRLSIETVNEGNILLQKLINYPQDVSKPWKQNVLLLASGLSLQDELQFGFNDASLYLGNTFVKPNGYSATYVFRYPSKPEHEPYQGEGPKIREEFNNGAAFVNYYGHGGGYQWDLVFTNDDIYLLENEGRLPVISSVTCYTAHFDNQNVFGEQFNKVEGKGSIGFYGSSGLTYWGVGTAINLKIFDQIFNKRNFIIGKAIMNGKNQVPSGGIYGDQINLQTYLGDPVMKLTLPNFPDFAIKSEDISLIPENPLIGDTIQVKIKISNWGTVFPDDSVTVELLASSADTSYQVGLMKRPNFPEKDSVYFTWIPNKGGLYTLTAKVNETDIIQEEDHSDNIANARFIIFNIHEPSTLKPIDGFVTTANQVEFIFSDIGHYLHKELRYYIQIDTSLNFSSPLYSSGELVPQKTFVKWTTPVLPAGVYFWRARIFDGTQYGNWSTPRSFSIITESKDGYFAHENILKTFLLYNIKYSSINKSLLLNTEPLSARPSVKNYLNDINIVPQIPDTTKLSTITTDGTYIYFANMRFYAEGLTNGMSMIYRVGTGNNGTIEGQYYGTFSTFYDTVLNSIFYHSDGNLYVAIGKVNKLVRINISNQQIDTIDVPAGILRWDDSRQLDGQQYLTSDGNYVYNLTILDSLGNKKYTVRTFDPANNWSILRPDIHLFGESYHPGFTGFFVHGDYIYTCEEYNNFMRKYRIDDGFFVEEWLVMEPRSTNFRYFFSWCWDWQNDKIYSSVFHPGVEPKFGKFAGYYVDANGTITTPAVGPVAWWNSLKYDFNNPSPTGELKTYLLGENSTTKNWDTLLVNFSDSVLLTGINADIYNRLRMKFDLTDSSFTTTQPMELKNVHFDYHPLSDVYFDRDDFHFQQDSLLQGYPVTFDFKARSFGDLPADTLHLNFYLNGLDSLFFTPTVSVPADSFSNTVQYTLETNKLLFKNTVQVFGEQNKREYFYFNNLIDKDFFVARDSIRPAFSVTFDGQEIIDNDIVSSTPQVVITLEDNSPLPLDTTFFTIVHNNIPLHFYDPDISWEYQGAGTPFIVTWNPKLQDGRHTLEILAKDASGNFFDSTSYRIIFFVYSENDISDVFNYPNPFATNTHFTFILKGNDKPDEIDIKIYTIAGRLIRDIKLASSDLITNFNKIPWDGRDQDGDEIGNGVYLYKVIAKFPDKTKTITQKLAKVR